MKMQDIPWVIVQAGGKGTRLEHLTFNKPKCLVSVAGKPLLYHLFDAFPNSNFIVIGDYLYPVLCKYLKLMAPRASVRLIRSKGVGTIGGIKDALKLLPEKEGPILIAWSDLLFSGLPGENIKMQNLIGLSRRFSCRWAYINKKIVHKTSSRKGISGFFIFSNKKCLKNIPNQGEFVRWLSNRQIKFKPIYLDDVQEFGTLEDISKFQSSHTVSRFFNDVKILGNKVIKRPRVKQFEHLIEKELNWYRKVKFLGFNQVPKLLSAHPMTLAYIDGDHPFNLNISNADKEKLLQDIFDQLSKLHSLIRILPDHNVMKEVYFDKTVERVNSISKLIPHIKKECVRVNGVLCRNPFHKKNANWFYSLVSSLKTDHFALIHGDPTFSNMLVDKRKKVWFIDPRGHFGSSNLYGDPLYDWSKLYYSVIGNYDSFNRRLFKLQILPQHVTLDIKSNGWEDMGFLFKGKFKHNIRSIRIAHALIWLSLSGYVNDDYDSILGAFYNGILWLERT